MTESIISEGKTTQEAIENGLKKLNVTKDKVEINIIENTEKRSFFSILTPRVVKVELRLKENIIQKSNHNNKNEIIHKAEQLEERKEKIEKFLNQMDEIIQNNKINFKIEVIEDTIKIDIYGESLGFLIGYRGETLNSLQTILSSIANNGYTTKVKVMLDIQGYRNKRKKVLEELAVKVAKTVLKNGNEITLEPMTAYERKIIHNKLQENEKITTHSIGEEPNRRIVISIIK